LGEDFRVRVAVDSKADQPLATVVSMVDPPRSTVYALVAGFDADRAGSQGTAFVHWSEIEAARDMGLETLDFMGADVESNVRFKAEFGGTVVPYFQVSHVSRLYRIAGALLP